MAGQLHRDNTEHLTQFQFHANHARPGGQQGILPTSRTQEQLQTKAAIEFAAFVYSRGSHSGSWIVSRISGHRITSIVVSS